MKFNVFLLKIKNKKLDSIYKLNNNNFLFVTFHTFFPSNQNLK